MKYNKTPCVRVFDIKNTMSLNFPHEGKTFYKDELKYFLKSKKLLMCFGDFGRDVSHLCEGNVGRSILQDVN